MRKIRKIVYVTQYDQEFSTQTEAVKAEFIDDLVANMRGVGFTKIEASRAAEYIFNNRATLVAKLSSTCEMYERAQHNDDEAKDDPKQEEYFDF